MSAMFSPQQGRGLTSAQSQLGQTISSRRRGKWRHPWETQAIWLPAARQWVATMEPGFVNATSPIVRTTIEAQKIGGKDFGTNPLTGRKYFSASVFSQPTREEARRQIEVPLYLSPVIPMAWRALGFDGPPGSTVPEYFRNRGAADAPQRGNPLSEDFDPLAVAEPPRGLRLLRVCDLILHQPRLALTSQIALLDGPATGFSNVTQTLSVRSIAVGDVLRVYPGTFTPPAPQIDGLAGGLLGLYEEETWDERLAARVYLLSPPNTPPGSEPDGTWQAFVKHGLFWNLNYATPTLRILDSDPGLPFIPPLAAGAAQLVINFLTASINDATRQALNILAAHSMAGTFWTPTGGGSTAAFPDVPVAESAGGLDKAKRLQRERIADAARKNSQKLDPAFPFVAMPFDSQLLAA
jgi:hypothetical protein